MTDLRVQSNIKTYTNTEAGYSCIDLVVFRQPEMAEVRGGRLEIRFPLPVHGISLLEIRTASPKTGEGG